MLDNYITIYNSTLIDSAYVQGLIAIQVLQVHTPPRPTDTQGHYYIVRVELLQQEPTIVEFDNLNSAMDYYNRQIDYYNIILPQIDVTPTYYVDTPYTIL